MLKVQLINLGNGGGRPTPSPGSVSVNTIPLLSLLNVDRILSSAQTLLVAVAEIVRRMR